MVLMVGCLLAGCSIFSQAPLEDGLYLVYDYAGSTIKVTFKEIGKGQFKATVSPAGIQKEEIVDKKLMTDDGRIYEIEPLGPLWIPSSSVRVGGDAHGDSVKEVKHWRKWDVGVVKASFGMGGALTGEWYYEKTTGFLVGGSKTSALQTMLSDEGSGATTFVLRRTNLEGL